MNNLKYLRTQANLSLRQLSDMVKISHTTLQLLENGKRILKIETAQILADFYNVSLNFLIGETNNGIYICFNKEIYDGLFPITKEQCDYYLSIGEIKLSIDLNAVWRITSETLQDKLIISRSKERNELVEICEKLTDNEVKDVLEFITKYIIKK